MCSNGVPILGHHIAAVSKCSVHGVDVGPGLARCVEGTAMIVTAV
jgi:hypothetical protein